MSERTNDALAAAGHKPFSHAAGEPKIVMRPKKWVRARASIRRLLAAVLYARNCMHGGAVTYDAPLSDLESKGYVVVPSFLTPAEVRWFVSLLRRAKRAENQLYNLSHPPRWALDRVRPKLVQVAADVSANTDLNVDLPQGAVYFDIDRGVDFPWHQEHESYFTTQNHRDYLNFFVPLIKPDPARTNLKVIPFDALQSRSPAAFAQLVGGGARRLATSPGKTVVHDDNDDSKTELDFSIDEVGVTPQLRSGDLLLLRGDVIHATQDTDTHRVAISFRVANSHTMVSRTRLIDGGLTKLKLISGGYIESYQQMFAAFEEAQSDELRLAQIIDYSKQHVPVGLSRDEFRIFLLNQRQQSQNGSS